MPRLDALLAAQAATLALAAAIYGWRGAAVLAEYVLLVDWILRSRVAHELVEEVLSQWQPGLHFVLVRVREVISDQPTDPKCTESYLPRL